MSCSRQSTGRSADVNEAASPKSSRRAVMTGNRERAERACACLLTATSSPKGMPKDIVGRLNAAAVEALAEPTVQSRLVDLGMEVFPREQQTPEVLGALVKAGADKW